MPKTGTASLNRALQILGFKSTHGAGVRAQYIRGDYSFVDDFEAVTNLFEHMYPVIDVAYPGTRFIWTYRDMKSWLRSVSSAYKVRPETELALRAWLAAFHHADFDRAIFHRVNETHKLGVDRYFHRRSRDILRMNVCAGEGWEKLCPFLGCPVPVGVPFPHANKKKEKLDVVCPDATTS